MNHTNASTSVQPADLLERITKMKAVIDEFNAAEREACEQVFRAMLATVEGSSPETHYLFCHAGFLLDHSMPRALHYLPPFVRVSNFIPRDRFYVISRGACGPFGLPL